MVAIGNYLVIEHLTDDEVTKGGLIIPDSLNKDIRYMKAKVISSGDSVTTVEDGDFIYYDKMAGHNISIDDKKYKVIEERNIVLKVD